MNLLKRKELIAVEIMVIIFISGCTRKYVVVSQNLVMEMCGRVYQVESDSCLVQYDYVKAKPLKKAKRKRKRDMIRVSLINERNTNPIIDIITEF